jgi:hypothetical protein
MTTGSVAIALISLRDLRELLERIDQADRAAPYQALRLTVRYRCGGSIEKVTLTSRVRSVDLERVVGNGDSRNSQVAGPRGVDLERVGGPTGNLGPRHVILESGWSELRLTA